MTNTLPAVVDRGALERTKMLAAYFQSGARILHGWNPPVRRIDDDVRAAGRSAMARAIDGLHNSGWLAGAIETIVGQMIGTGLQLVANPHAEKLGWSPKQADAFRTAVEQEWNTVAKEPELCDAAGKQTIAQLTRAQILTWFAHGEHLATVEMIKRPGNNGPATRINVLDPLSLPREGARNTAQQGVITDEYGYARAYEFRLKHADKWTEETKQVSARDRNGRRLVCHVFDGGPGQRRGITPLAPALRVVRQFDQLSDATLTTTLLQTIFAATIKSTMPTEDVMSAIKTINDGVAPDQTALGMMNAQKQDWYKGAEIDLRDHGRIAHLFPNEALEFNTAKAPHDNYESFSRGLLREIARCIPCTYETFSGDYQGATYSSVRMATSEMWPILLYRRENIAARFPQFAYESFLEEQVALGIIEVPGGYDAFVENRAAICRATWRGPARPTADDYKSAQAAEARIKAGLSTLEHECAENGLDWEDVLANEKRVADKRESLGLPSAADMAASAKGIPPGGDPLMGDEPPAKPKPGQKPPQKGRANG